MSSSEDRARARAERKARVAAIMVKVQKDPTSDEPEPPAPAAEFVSPKTTDRGGDGTADEHSGGGGGGSGCGDEGPGSPEMPLPHLPSPEPESGVLLSSRDPVVVTDTGPSEPNETPHTPPSAASVSDPAPTSTPPAPTEAPPTSQNDDPTAAQLVSPAGMPHVHHSAKATQESQQQQQQQQTPDGDSVEVGEAGQVDEEFSEVMKALVGLQGMQQGMQQAPEPAGALDTAAGNPDDAPVLSALSTAVPHDLEATSEAWGVDAADSSSAWHLSDGSDGLPEGLDDLLDPDLLGDVPILPDHPIQSGLSFEEDGTIRSTAGSRTSSPHQGSDCDNSAPSGSGGGGGGDGAAQVSAIDTPVRAAGLLPMSTANTVMAVAIDDARCEIGPPRPPQMLPSAWPTLAPASRLPHRRFVPVDGMPLNKLMRHTVRSRLQLKIRCGTAWRVG